MAIHTTTNILCERLDCQRDRRCHGSECHKKNCSVCGQPAARCFCPCPLCGGRTDTLPSAAVSCQCAYEDLSLALADAKRALSEGVARADALTATFQLKQTFSGEWRVIVTTPNGDCHEFTSNGEHAQRVLRDAATAIKAANVAGCVVPQRDTPLPTSPRVAMRGDAVRICRGGTTSEAPK